MIKLFKIAREELLYYLRQWTFYLIAIGMPLIFAGLGALPQLQAATEQTPLASVETIFTETEMVVVPTGYVDKADIIQTVPPEQAEKFLEFSDAEAAALALKEGEIESYYIIASDYLTRGTVTQFSNNPQLLSGEDAVVSRLLHDNLLDSLDNEVVAARLNNPVQPIRHGPPQPVFSFIPADTEISELISAGLVLMLFAYLLNAGGSFLLRSLQREARARVLEVLIASTTPEQFVGGKLLGLILLTLGQAGVTLLAGTLVFGRNTSDFGPAALSPWVIIACIPYLLFGYLAYCGILMSVAAVWPNLPESATLLAMMRLITFAPLLGVVFILPKQHGTISILLTLFPLTSSLLMPFRLLIGEVPLWQWGVGVALLALWATFTIWLSMRFFRAQSLLTGRTPSLKTLWLVWRG